MMTGSWLLGRLTALVAVLVLPGTTALHISSLPRHPEIACASPQVTSVLTGCKFTGATAPCCQKLDDLFYEAASPAAGCLCYPGVLYRVIEKASQRNFDVLRLFTNCSQQFNAKTDWAMRSDTACPDIPVNATSLDIASKLGNAALLDSAANKPTWAWSHLLQGGDVMAFPQMKHDVLAVKVVGLSCVQFLLVILISLAPIFLIMHKLILVRFSKVYTDLNGMQQLVTCQHAVYALLFSLQLVPQTVIALRFLFRAWSGDYIASQEVSLLVGVFILSRAALYLVEACVRSVNTSVLLLVHHQLFFTIILMGVWTENTALLSIGVVLDLFACHEALLYVVLVSYRLKLNIAFTKVMLYTSCIWYSITRVFQTVVLVYMIVCWAANPDVKLTPGFIITAMLCGAFTFIQAYTLVIYKAIGIKLHKSGRSYKSNANSSERSCGLSYSGKWPDSESSAGDAASRAQSDALQTLPDVSVAIDDCGGQFRACDSAKDVCEYVAKARDGRNEASAADNV